MKKYLSAVSEMYSQFKKKETHPPEKYVGRRGPKNQNDVVFKNCERYYYVDIDNLID